MTKADVLRHSSIVSRQVTQVRPAALLVLVLLAGATLRLGLLLGPHREIDADEAVVGLMALQVPRELPPFFWEQHYLGSLEALVAAAFFAIAGPSGPALKAVPALFSLLFVVLTYATARRAFGVGPALLAATYLAIPPSFLAVWSVKARGGYAELLALGQLFLLLCQMIADRSSEWTDSKLGAPSSQLAAGVEPAAAPTWLVLLAGLVGGLALWTHPLAVIYLAAGAVYVAFSTRQGGWCRTLGPASVGFAVGLLPAIAYNVAEGLPSLRFAATGGTGPGGALLNLWGLARYGAPVLAGLAEGTPSKALLDADWPRRPGSSFLAMGVLLLLAAFVVWYHRRSLAAIVRRDPCPGRRAAAPFLLLLLLIPAFVAVSRFAELWAEPRYALPAYGAVPLFTVLAWRLRERSRVLFAALVAGVLAVNAASLATGDPRLSLPVSAGASTEANRSELIDYLLARDLTRIYTDYWIAYPLAFESREQILPAVRSGGFDRRHAYAHEVSVAREPAFVFPTDAPGDLQFRRDLADLGGTADVAEVSVYRVYTNVRPLEPLRGPRRASGE